MSASSQPSGNKTLIYVSATVLIAFIVWGIVVLVKSHESYVQGCGCSPNFSVDHHDDISESYPDMSRQARSDKKCLTGYYGPGCVLSVGSQTECPSNYFSDPQCKKKGCFSVPCDESMMYRENELSLKYDYHPTNDPRNFNYYESNDFRQFP